MFALECVMAVDMYLKVESVNGDSQDAQHKEWTDIQSFSWGASQLGSMSTGGGTTKASA